MKKNGERVIACICIVIGILMFVFTKDFSYGGLESFGTGFWPRILAALLIIFSIIQIVSSTFSKKADGEEIVIDWKSDGMKRIYKLIVITVIFGILIKLIGLIPALIFMFFAVMWIMEERRWKWLILTSVGFPVGAYVIFNILLKVSLPTGILF